MNSQRTSDRPKPGQAMAMLASQVPRSSSISLVEQRKQVPYQKVIFKKERSKILQFLYHFAFRSVIGLASQGLVELPLPQVERVNVSMLLRLCTSSFSVQSQFQLNFKSNLISTIFYGKLPLSSSPSYSYYASQLWIKGYPMSFHFKGELFSSGSSNAILFLKHWLDHTPLLPYPRSGLPFTLIGLALRKAPLSH